VRPSILVVDDEPQNIRVIEAAPSGVDADVLSAVSRIRALELAEGHRIVRSPVLDVCMPEMDGFDLALRLQSSQEYQVFLGEHVARTKDTSERHYRLY